MSYHRESLVVPVLYDITFDIPEGEFLALMGPSGSGKTTLLNLIAGIDKADSGSIRIGNIEVTDLSETELAPPFGDDAFIPDFFVGIEQTIEIKMAAFKCFGSQIRIYPNSRSPEALEALAKLRGCSVGIPYAEAFMTIRIIEE